MHLNGDGSNLVTAGKDGVLRIFDAQSCKQITELKGGDGKLTVGHSNRVFSAVFNDKNYNILYSGGWDQTVQCWDLRVGHSVFSMHNLRVFGDSIDVKE